MNLLLALAIAVLFGSGAFLTFRRDLVRVVAGISLMFNAANLFLIAAGLARGAAPIHPLPEGQVISDPLAQALVLKAVLVSFGITALLLTLVYSVCRTHQSLSTAVLLYAEEREAAVMQHEGEPP